MGSSFSQQREAEPRAEQEAEPELLHSVGSTELTVPVVKNGEQPCVEQQGTDFQGDEFQKVKPVMKVVGQHNPQFTRDDLQLAPPLQLKSLNHAAIGANDVDAIKRFYTKVLGFQDIPRPELGFPGHWLYGLGMMIHIIQHDPTVPLRIKDWKDIYSQEPEAWFIRRGHHLAFEVEDFEEAERMLRQHGVEYSRHVLPEANVHQLFLFDPEGNGIELGVYDNTRAFLASKGCDVDV